jgi:hypothetical protein
MFGFHPSGECTKRRKLPFSVPSVVIKLRFEGLMDQREMERPKLASDYSGY